MTSTTDDPRHLRALADATVQRAAEDLRAQLDVLVGQVEPFPSFPGAVFAYGIEVEPPAHSSLGCVIVGDDGALYELQIGLDHVAIASGGDALAQRHEELLKLELPPREFVAYAHSAIEALTSYLGERAAAG